MKINNDLVQYMEDLNLYGKISQEKIGSYLINNIYPAYDISKVQIGIICLNMQDLKNISNPMGSTRVHEIPLEFL